MPSSAAPPSTRRWRPLLSRTRSGDPSRRKSRSVPHLREERYLQSVRLTSPRIGELVVEQYEVPDRPPAGGILVAAHVTIVSAGTEIANYLGRTTERPPERVTPYHPGYSFAGEVLAAGEAVERFHPGDRIAGPLGHAAHAVEDRPERLARF